MIVHKCDGCLKEMKYLKFERVRLPGEDLLTESEFCPDCYKKIADLIARMKREALAETPQT